MDKTGQHSSLSLTVVCQVFYPDNQSTSQLLTDLFTRLAMRGFQIDILCGYPVLLDNEIECSEFPNYENYRNLKIIRSGLQLNFKKNLFYRALHYSVYILMTTWKIGRRSRCDIIFGVTNPPFTPVWLWITSKIFRFKYQLMLGDVFPDGLVGLNYLKPNGLVNRVWTWANRCSFAKADRIVVLGRDMSELLQHQYKVPREKINYVPHWSAYEPEKRKKAENTALWQRLKLNDSFVIQYSGNMGLWHDIETLVRAAYRLRDEEPSIRFLFIGDGSRAKSAKRLAEKLNCTNIIWLPFQQKESLDDSIACCHLSIISQRKGTEGVAVPCKLYGILAAGRGVIGMVPERSEVARVLREERCGVVLNPDDDKNLAEEIKRLTSNQVLVSKMGENAFSAYRSKYTLDIAVNNFLQLWKPHACNASTKRYINNRFLEAS